MTETTTIPTEDQGPVCEDCLRALPAYQVITTDPRILCEECQDVEENSEDTPEFTEAQLAKQKELWATVDDHANRALAIAWDGCHKIYLLMDETQVMEMRRRRYGKDNDGSALVTGTSKKEMRSLVHLWYEASCGLRFIHAVATSGGDCVDDFTTLISQEDGWEFFAPHTEEDE